MEVITDSLKLKREGSEANVTHISIQQEKHLFTAKRQRERILQYNAYSNK